VQRRGEGGPDSTTCGGFIFDITMGAYLYLSVLEKTQ